MTTPDAIYRPDRRVYLRDHLVMAAGAAGLFFVILLLTGNTDPWVALPAAALAIGIRGWYLSSELLTESWTLDDGRLTGPHERATTLGELSAVNRLGSAVQLVTRRGDKHLIRYLADPAAVQANLKQAAGL